ncbi:TOM1-like protein 2 [Linum grandiflorum]
MDKLKLAEWGERLRTGGAQMSRVVSDKMKEILQAPTPESKMVDDATAETLAEPNWGLNLRICALINSEEFNCADVVRAIKKKISGKSEVAQRLSLDLLEACTMNCEKVFSAVASEKALDEMVKLIDNPLSDPENRSRAMQLIAAWGESEDLEYLPVFRQTYMVSLKQRSVLPEGNVAPVENSLESYFQPMPPPGSYPVPDSGLPGLGQGTFPQNYLSAEEKNEVLVTTRNSLELLSSILNAETEPKPIKEDLTVSLYEKCQQSQPAVQQLIESTTDDEAMLFEALNLHDELQRVISQFKDLEAGLEQSVKSPESSEPAPAVITVSQDHGKLPDGEGAESSIGENRKSIIDMKAGN